MNKRLIFTVTTGRSGTSFLSYQLSHLKKVDVFHEPEPRFNLHFHKAIQNNQYAKRFLGDVKLQFISKLPHSIYIESSHFFCKGFFEPLIEMGYVPDLILLSRDRIKVAKSLYELDTIPGDSKDYLYASEFQFVDTSSWSDCHDFQKCLLYCDEITARQREYSKIVKNNGGKVVYIQTKDLNNRKKLARLIKELELPGFSLKGRLRYEYRQKVSHISTNQKKSEKKRVIDEKLISELVSEIK